MTVSRRALLAGLGVGASAGLVSSAAALTSETEVVFVHPANGLQDGLFAAIDLVGGTIRHEYDNFAFVAADVPADRLDEVEGDPSVSFLERDGPVEIPSGWSPAVPDLLDPGGGDCSTHPDQQPSWGVERIGADEVEETGTGVDVGILDTGIDTDHCSVDVAGGENVTFGVSGDYEDRHGHGTHVAGIAGAVDNDLGVVGTAPEADLYAVKVLDDSGSGRYSDLVAGIDWCMSNDVELVSMSLGGESRSDSVDEAVATAHEAGHLLLSAAGNDGNEGDGRCGEETMTYPATHEDVVAVTAMNEGDTLASYSSVGSGIELLAPGTAVTSTTAGNEYAEASGTSMACPYVTGVAALVWETRTEDGPGPNESVREALTDTAETVLDTCEEGHGLVDATAALGHDGGTDSVVGSVISTLEWIVGSIVGVFKWLGQLVGGILEWLYGLVG